MQLRDNENFTNKNLVIQFFLHTFIVLIEQLIPHQINSLTVKM